MPNEGDGCGRWVRGSPTHGGGGKRGQMNKVTETGAETKATARDGLGARARRDFVGGNSREVETQ